MYQFLYGHTSDGMTVWTGKRLRVYNERNWSC